MVGGPGGGAHAARRSPGGVTGPLPDLPLPAGSGAPSFRLEGSDGKVTDLRQVLEGSRALLLFYPGNDTPGCDRQLATARDEIDRYRRAGIRLLGVNPATPAAHADYASRLALPFVLLSDPGLAVSRRYHAVRAGIEEIDRTVYLIDRDGAIIFSARGAPGADIVLEDLGEA